MAFEKKVPEWGAAGSEPPATLKQSGFQAGYKPPADYFNWFWHSVSEALAELQSKTVRNAKNTLAAEDYNDPNITYPYVGVVTGDTAVAMGLTSGYWDIIYLPHLHNNGYGVQLAFPYAGTGDTQARWRYATGENWEEWAKFYDTRNVPTLAELGAMARKPGYIELVPSADAGTGGYIDFHFNGSDKDYTSRIVEGASGTITIEASGGVNASNNLNVSKNLGVSGTASVSGTLTAGGGLKTGGSIVSDTSLADNVGAKDVPFNHVYNKSYFIYSGANKAAGRVSADTAGTATTQGEVLAVFGNDISTGTDGNARGRIRLFGTGAGYTEVISGNNGSGNLVLTLPNASGTLYGTGNKPTPQDLGALALGGGTLTGQLNANAGIVSGNTIRSGTALANNLGASDIPWNVLFAKTVSFRGNASGAACGDINVVTTGTTSTTGESRLTLGNNTATGSANNACGRIRLYGTGTGYTGIIPGNNTANDYTLTLPAKSGTVALTSDIPTTPAAVGAAAASHDHSAANITSGTLAVARGGTGVTANPSMLINLGSTTAASVFAASPRPGVTGTLPVARGGTGVTSIDTLISNYKLGKVVTGSYDGTAASREMSKTLTFPFVPKFVCVLDGDYFQNRFEAIYGMPTTTLFNTTSSHMGVNLVWEGTSLTFTDPSNATYPPMNLTGHTYYYIAIG